MSTENIFQVILMAMILSNGILGRITNEESTPREGAISSFWILEPEQLTAKGKVYRKWFIANLSVLLVVFLVWLALYK